LNAILLLAGARKKEMRLNGVAMLFRAKELYIADESAKLPECRIRAVTLISLFQMMRVRLCRVMQTSQFADSCYEASYEQYNKRIISC